MAQQQQQQQQQPPPPPTSNAQTQSQEHANNNNNKERNNNNNRNKIKPITTTKKAITTTKKKKKKNASSKNHNRMFQIMIIIVILTASFNIYLHHHYHMSIFHHDYDTNKDSSLDGKNGDHPMDIMHTIMKERNEMTMKKKHFEIIKKREQKQQQKQQQQEEQRQTKENENIHRESKEENQRQRQDGMETKDSSNLNGNNNNNNNNNERRIEEILIEAGVPITTELSSKLPLWSDIVSMYGSEPIIIGLETCKTFQKTIDPTNAYIGPAGMFNTGTNLLAELLHMNCILPNRMKKHGPSSTGMRWQVPWGKHTPASWRLWNIAQSGGKGVIQTDVLPVITIKDPYGWMGSMCRHSYAANWKHHKDHCPNLIPDPNVDVDNKKKNIKTGSDGAIPVSVRYKPTNATLHSSLVGLWNDWYDAYYHQQPSIISSSISSTSSYPRLIIRFEDLLFHTKTVIEKVCICGGGQLKNGNDDNHNNDDDKTKQTKQKTKNFQYEVGSAKGNTGSHSGSSGLVSAILRYGSSMKRTEGMTMDDMMYARKSLNETLMSTFGYSYPPLSSSLSSSSSLPPITEDKKL